MAGLSSRILRAGERSRVEPVPWRETGAPPPLPVIDHPPPPVAVTEEPLRDLEVERAERDGYQRGFSEGKRIGQDQATAELQVVLDRLARNLAELSTLRSRIRKDAEADLLKLSIAVARRVLHRELTLDPESIDGLIRVALEKLEARELHRVRVHPNQEHAVRNAMARFAGTQKVEVVPDAALQSGDVLFETPQGALDASIETQLREIERGFADRLRR